MSSLNYAEAYKGRTVLVTGGTGFIGSHLVRRLVQYDANVIVIEDFSSAPRDHIEDVEPEIQLIESDIANVSRPLPGFSETECILHLAAATSVSRSLSDPMVTHRANVTGTLRILEIARRVDPETAVMVGTSLRGGAIDASGQNEQVDPPASLYAASKGAMELYTAAYHERFSVPGVVLRPSRVFGPRQHRESGYTESLSSLIEDVLNGERPELPEEQREAMDYVYVDDVVDALLIAGQSPGAAGKRFDICSGTSFSERELLEMIVEYSENEPKEPRYGKRDNNYRERKHLCPDRAQEELGFKAKTSFKEGLERTINWFQDQV